MDPRDSKIVRAFAVHGVHAEASAIYADITMILWKWVEVDPKENNGLDRRPLFFYLNDAPIRINLDCLQTPGMSVRDLSLAAIEDSLSILFDCPVSKITSKPLPTKIRNLPPSQRAAAAKKEAQQTAGILKSWRRV